MPLEAPVITAVCLWLLFMAIKMELTVIRFANPTLGMQNRVTVW
jgi:hypothetical protein